MFLGQSDLTDSGKLGQGAYSEVWRARQRLPNGLHRPVIVRYMPVVANLHAFGLEKEIYRRALRENLTGIPHLLEVRRVGVGYLQIFQDAFGASLREHLSRGPLRVDEATQLLLSVLRTLRVLNGWGLIHSDLKPSNLIWDASLQMGRVIDLTDAYKPGPAYHYEYYIGDKRYAPPERMQGWLEVSSQVFMLGLTLWETLSGAPPFDVSDERPFLNMAQLCWRTLDMASLADAPLWLQRLIAHMVHPEAAKRPSFDQIESVLQTQQCWPVPEDGRGQTALPQDEEEARRQLGAAGYRYPRFREAVEMDEQGAKTTAKRLYSVLANEGYSRAQNNLGNLLIQEGRHTHALALFKAAFKHGNPYAAYNLGRAYAAGRGVEKDQNTARHYFEWAARRGHLQAKYRLADLLRKEGRSAAADFWHEVAQRQEKGAYAS